VDRAATGPLPDRWRRTPSRRCGRLGLLQKGQRRIRTIEPQQMHGPHMRADPARRRRRSSRSRRRAQIDRSRSADVPAPVTAATSVPRGLGRELDRQPLARQFSRAEVQLEGAEAATGSRRRRARVTCRHGLTECVSTIDVRTIRRQWPRPTALLTCRRIALMRADFRAHRILACVRPPPHGIDRRNEADSTARRTCHDASPFKTTIHDSKRFRP
jgi:hypothetical protein